MRDNKSAYNAAIYDDHIVNVLLYYREYHGQILDLVRSMERVWTMEKGRNAEKRGIALERWLHFLESRGNPPEDVRMHRDRRGIEIFPITIEEHIALLRKCGFSSVDLLWTSYLQAGFWAVK